MLPISLRHPNAAAGEPFPQLAFEDCVDDRLLAEDGGDRLARQIVLGRSETAGGNDEVRPTKRSLKGLPAAGRIVADR